MTLNLQRFDFRSSQYERPNQEWQCGRMAHGRPCRVGPSATGQCRAVAECRPLKKGDRWVCTRPDMAGGRCVDGPLPDGSCCNPIPKCAPVPSIRRQRGMSARYLVALVVGALLLFGAGTVGDAFFSPGPLTSGHSEIADCGTCHSGYSGGPIVWAHRMFADGTEAADMKNCLSCHENRDGTAHSQTAEAMAPLTEAALARASDAGQTSSGPLATRLAASLGFGVRTAADGQVACRSCHQEHRGHKADISAMGDTQCQACHTSTFGSFNDGHPSFGDYPYTRRTRIQFDHVGHIQRYFQDATNRDRAPATCRSCHMPDDQGKLMVLEGFEANCAACHGDFIANRPVVFMELPGIDLDGLIDLDAPVGEWPFFAEAEEVSPFVHALLSSNEEYMEARRVLDEYGTDMFFLDDASDEEIDAIVGLVWAYKGLIYDLMTGGPEFIRERLEAAVGSGIDRHALQQLIGLMPMDTIEQVQRKWLPNLMEEVEAYRDGEDVSIPDELPEIPIYDDDRLEPADWAEMGGWFTEFHSLKYRLTGHADPFMRAWLDLAASEGQQSEVMAGVLEALTGSRAPGGCVDCHSIDVIDDAGTVNWRGRQLEAHTKPFTEFVHAKHFALIGDRGCLTCHTIDPEADYKASFADRDPTSFTSNFAPLDQGVCAECHQPTLAGADCTSCHNYHVGAFPPAAVHTEMAAFPSD